MLETFSVFSSTLPPSRSLDANSILFSRSFYKAVGHTYHRQSCALGILTPDRIARTSEAIRFTMPS